MSNNSYTAFCPQCGENIRITDDSLKYIYCPACSSKILTTDARSGNLSDDFIEAMSGTELDEIIKRIGSLKPEKLELAAKKGSVIASIKGAERYLKKYDYKTAKKFYDFAAAVDGPTGKYGSLVCSLKSDPYVDCANVLSEIRSIDVSLVKHYSQEAIDILSSVRQDAQHELDVKQSSYSPSYSAYNGGSSIGSSYDDYSYSGDDVFGSLPDYPVDPPLSDSELNRYFHEEMLCLWNPNKVDNDPNLTPEQKEYIKDYSRIWGD